MAATQLTPDNELAALAAWLTSWSLEHETRPHPNRYLCDIMPPPLAVPALHGQHQLVVSSPRGEISVVLRGDGDYEIYCLSGDLFEDVEQYDTVVETGEAILWYMENGS